VQLNGASQSVHTSLVFVLFGRNLASFAKIVMLSASWGTSLVLVLFGRKLASLAFKDGYALGKPGHFACACSLWAKARFARF